MDTQPFMLTTDAGNVFFCLSKVGLGRERGVMREKNSGTCRKAERRTWRREEKEREKR